MLNTKIKQVCLKSRKICGYFWLYFAFSVFFYGHLLEAQADMLGPAPAVMVQPNVQPMTDNAVPVLEDIRVEAIFTGKMLVDLAFSQPVASPKSFQTETPARLILDFIGVDEALKSKIETIAVGFLESYEVIKIGNRTRVILNLKETVKDQIIVNENHVCITLVGETYIEKSLLQDEFASNPWAATEHGILGVDFRRDEGGGGRVIVDLSDAKMGINVNQLEQEVIVDFIDTSAPPRLQRKLDVTDFGTPIQHVTLRAHGSNMQMIVNTTGSFKQLAYQVNNQFIVDVSPDTKEEIVGVGARNLETFTGERLSLNFQDIPVRAVLQLLAEFSGINLVASDTVKGNMTIRLNNVPWDEALAIIMKAQVLAQRKIGNVIMIAPQEEVSAKEKQELASKKEVKSLEPLVTEIINLNYAIAKSTAELLKSQGSTLLSPRGNVSVDERTNSLLVQDTFETLANIHALIKKVDVPVKQVLIEARLVNVDVNFEKNLGIRWGVSKPVHVSGTLRGADQMVQNVINGLNPLFEENPVIDVLNRLNVNLPATPTTGTPGSFGVAVAKLGRGFLLDLEISALESEGVGEVIASPRLVTSNQHEAYIEKGEQIPYQEQTSSGATSVQFINAVLGLRVTPLITPDGGIVLKLKINEDKRSAQPEVLGVPAIDTQQIETNVLVENGETIVLGGIYQETKQRNVLRIPFLGTLPVIGDLFKTSKTQSERTELLIFITPKIVQQSAIE